MFARTIAARAGSAPCRVCNRGITMPLRSKVLGAGAAQMSTKPLPREFKSLPEDDPDDVMFNSLYGVRSIELNRPKKLNSLNASMIRKIVPRMREWERSDMANVIVMKGIGEKAFCAGGDVTALAQYNKEEGGWKKSADYFALEYKLNHYIATYKKPYVAIMDGITMGGGVGLSIHAPFRIATERTLFAMPETTIGFFPDVGASFFLPRMNGSTGTYLALTSERLKGVNVFYSGIATHYLHSTSLAQVEARLSEMRFNDYDTLETRLAKISATLQEYSTGLPYDEPMLLAGGLREAIDRCFSKDNMVEIIDALKAEEGAHKAWAEKTLDTLHKRSPTAVNVALRQMRLGSSWSICTTFRREHAIATQFMKHPDFVEGVTAQLMSKGNPRAPVWQPATLEDIENPAEIVDPFFEKSSDELELLSDENFKHYPHAGLGLPSERDVERVVQSDMFTPEEVREHMLSSFDNRQGVAQVLSDIMERKIIADPETGKAAWKV